MNRYILPLSVLGTAVGGAVLLKDFVAGGACPSKTTIPGKTVIVTGANTGIGKQTALELAKRGGTIILACRDLEKCEAAAKEIRGETLNHHVNARHLDLASLKSIREFAAKIIEEEERVHILINNAAVMRCPHWTTEDGFEMQLGVNYLGHFLLTNLLLDKLKASAPSRIINLSSLAHVAGHIDFEDLNWEKRKYDTKAAYCQSKLAVVLFTKELSRRLQGTGVTVNALHPGVARTELGRHTGMHRSAFSSFTLDLPEVYLNPPGDEYLPTVTVTSVISLLPFLFLLIFLLCRCWCRAKNKATEDETKSQVNDDSSSPDMDFQEENQHDVSEDIPPEEDRQMDMHVHAEEDLPESSESSAQLHQDPLTGSGDSLPSCTTEDSSK
ncbi:retinol dehydrogenase 13 isoform X4 [Balaenoptera acutorostrata]|uniref:Retinol dehydrogenase 13 isoform X4 n=1 Tax=Balaenoptera acutorostrata TaxID=9767 RepID=A0ABM3SIA1_BALAC|nr:retinol dehydrogenase 13 isoform X4 [Balaenoptera acutorostrata]